MFEREIGFAIVKDIAPCAKSTVLNLGFLVRLTHRPKERLGEYLFNCKLSATSFVK
jgi:hypothetical protein